jgi:hypothetical protein
MAEYKVKQSFMSKGGVVLKNTIVEYPSAPKAYKKFLEAVESAKNSEKNPATADEQVLG